MSQGVFGQYVGSMPAQPHALPSARVRRVLITTDSFAPAVNGVVASVLTLRAELEALGCEVRILTLSEGLSSYRDGNVYRLGSVPAPGLYDQARVGTLRSAEVYRDIVAWSPDVIHSQQEFTTYVWARRLAERLNIPLVHTYHTIYEDYTHYFSPSRSMGRKLAATFSRRILAPTDAVIAPTAKVRTMLRSYGVRSDIHVSPTGLDLTHYRPARTWDEERETQQLRRQLGIDPGQRILLSLGRLAREKNIEELFDLLETLNDPRLTLLIVGDGPHREQLQARAHRSPARQRIVFAGSVPPSQAPAYYRLADGFVSASRSETQGLTYIDALATGLPALCRRDPSLHEVIIDGVNGWQYESSEEFRTALNHLDDPIRYQQVAAAATAWAQEHASASAFGRSVLSIYETLAQRRDRRALGSRPAANKRRTSSTRRTANTRPAAAPYAASGHRPEVKRTRPTKPARTREKVAVP